MANTYPNTVVNTRDTNTSSYSATPKANHTHTHFHARTHTHEVKRQTSSRAHDSIELLIFFAQEMLRHASFGDGLSVDGFDLGGHLINTTRPKVLERYCESAREILRTRAGVVPGTCAQEYNNNNHN